jgi:hypothetical protein
MWPLSPWKRLTVVMNAILHNLSYESDAPLFQHFHLLTTLLQSIQAISTKHQEMGKDGVGEGKENVRNGLGEEGSRRRRRIEE